MPKNDTFGNMEQIIVEISANQREQNQTDFEKYSNDPNYVDVKFDLATGGLKARHKGHHRDPKGVEHFGLKTYELEDAFQDTIVAMGGSCILLDESMKRPNGETATGLDALVNGMLTDIRTVTKSDTNIRNCIKEKHSQLVGYNKDFGVAASTVSLFYYDDSYYSDDKVRKGISDYIKIASNRKEGIVVKRILVVLKNQKQMIEYIL